MKKINFKLMLLFVLALSVSSCSSSKKDDKIINIGIIQVVDHPSLDAARLGFIDELKKNGYEDGKQIKIDYQNAQNDLANLKSIAKKMVKDSDYIYAIATHSAQSVKSETDTIPIIITAVTDPVDAGLVSSMDKAGSNVTGTSDMVPIDKQIDLLLKTKEVKKVGLLYTKSESNSKIQIDLAKKHLDKLGVDYVEMAATSSNDVMSVTKALMEKVDVVYIPTDNTISATMATVAELSKELKVPVVPGSIEMAEIGGVATFGINYTDLGIQSAKIVLKMLKGEAKVEELKVEMPEILQLYINEELSKKLGVDTSKLEVK